MQKNRLVVSVITVTALLSFGEITHAQIADASTLYRPMMLADAGMDLKKIKMGDTATTIHHGTGTVKKIDATAGKVTLAHDPIVSLNWPGMTMVFKLKDASLAKGIKSGDAVNFDLIESGDEYIVTHLQLARK